ncbi:MAG: YbhB/YbcL family Raf kinase inhibitor-like protein [Bacillota bacterium]
MPAFKLVSSAFQDHAAMDKRFSCQGGDISPPLAWVGAPTGTKSFALVMDDPDAPMGTWVHWVVYGLPASVNALAEGAAKSMPTGSRDGKNSWGKAGYGGPCPPSGTHRYFHKLYALDTLLPDLHKPDKAALEAAMKGHVLAEAELVGTYQKH